jgi:hypothetical protein
MGNTCCTASLDTINKPLDLSDVPRGADLSSGDSLGLTPALATGSSPAAAVPVVGQSMRTAPPRVAQVIRTDGQELASVRPVLQSSVTSSSLRPTPIPQPSGCQTACISDPRHSVSTPLSEAKSPLRHRQIKASAFTSSLGALTVPATPLVASNPLSPSGSRPTRAVGCEVQELPTFAPRQLNLAGIGEGSSGLHLYPAADSSTTSTSFASSSLTNRRYNHLDNTERVMETHVDEDGNDDGELSFPCSPSSQHGSSAPPQRRTGGNEETSSRVSFRDHALVLGNDDPADGLVSSGSDGEDSLFFQQEQQQQQQQRGSNGGRRPSNAIGYCDNRSSSQPQRSRVSSLLSMEGSVNSSTTECFSVSSAVSLANSMCEEMGINLGSVTGLNTLAVPLVDEGNIGKSRHSRQIARKKKHQQRSLSRASSSAGVALQKCSPHPPDFHQQPSQQDHHFSTLTPMFSNADNPAVFSTFLDKLPRVCEGITSSESPLSTIPGIDGIVVQLPPATPLPATHNIAKQEDHHFVPDSVETRSPPCVM